MSLPLFQSNLDYIAAVTRMLNQLSPDAHDDFYIHVELRSTGDHKKVGEWSDEIAPDAWYFNETEQ